METKINYAKEIMLRVVELLDDKAFKLRDRIDMIENRAYDKDRDLTEKEEEQIEALEEKIQAYEDAMEALNSAESYFDDAIEYLDEAGLL